MVEEHRYFYSHEKHETELDRLGLVEEIYDPVTIRHLKIIGNSSGWDCLEVGAGAGSVAWWLARHVGPRGRVVATDTDPRFLSRTGVSNLEIRRHDIMKDGLETGKYDLVHCRLLLRHLSGPEEGLKRMADAVRPGGWILIEETDYGSILSTDITNPSAATFTSMFRTGLEFLRQRGIFDPYFGRRLRGIIEKLGFVDIRQEGWTCLVRGGEPCARLHAMIVQATAKPMLAAGLVTPEQFDTFQQFFADPAFEFLGPTMFAVWGRRPAR